MKLKNTLGRSCLAALVTQTWEVFHRAGALNVLYRGWTFCKQACMRDILNTYLPRDRKFKAWQPIPNRLCKKCDIGAPECTSVHGIGIVVLNKWMKCATKTQSLLASTPWSHKSHMTPPGYRSWFHFSFDHDVAHAFWRHRKQWRWQHVQPLRVHAIQSTWEQPSSYKASSRQSN